MLHAFQKNKFITAAVEIRIIIIVSDRSCSLYTRLSVTCIETRCICYGRCCLIAIVSNEQIDVVRELSNYVLGQILVNKTAYYRCIS